MKKRREGSKNTKEEEKLRRNGGKRRQKEKEKENEQGRGPQVLCENSTNANLRGEREAERKGKMVRNKDEE